MEKDIPHKQKPKGTDIVISGKRYLKSKTIKRNKDSHHIIIKGLIHQQVIMVLNIYTPNIRTF
jgi:hypothetical protein